MKRPNVDRPLVFAHRGASKAAPENTLPAFAQALDIGVDGVELDVRYTSDSQLAIVHDAEVPGLNGGPMPVSAATLEELRKLDVGAPFGTEFAGTRIPTLDEALNLLAGRCLVNIEVKSSAVSTVSMGRDIVAAIRSRNMEDQVLISSFNPFTLRLLKTEAPDIETAYLTAPDLPLWMRLGITRSYARADGIHPEYRMVSRSYMSWARRRGKPVRVWTVDDQADAVRMAHLGVDAIITNVPDTILAVLKA